MRLQRQLRIAIVGALALPLGIGATAHANQPSADPSATGPAAWVFGSMIRLRPTSPAGTSRHAHVSGARGETVAFQIGVHARQRDLTGAGLRLSALHGPGGSVIPARYLVRYREHFIKIAHHSPDYGGPVLSRHWFPDALLPFIDPETGKPPAADARYRASPFEVASGHTQALWVDVTVPRGTPAGEFTGSWTVSTDQGSVTDDLTVAVRDFTLPVRPAAGSSFQLYHRQTGANERLLLRYGIQPIPVDPSHEPALRKQGLESTDLGFWSGAYVGHCKMAAPPSGAELRQAVREHDDHLYLYNYTADEISRCKGLYPRVRTWARRLHAAGVDQLITMVPVSQVLHDGAGRLAVDLFTLLPVQFQDLDPAMRDTVLDRGGEFWSYQALVQGDNTPSWEIDFPGANYRILPGFLNARMGATGVLYWTVDYWMHDPWKNITYRNGGYFFPGEGNLVYTGGPAGVREDVPSIRLAWIRQGINDYGYVQLLRDLGRARLAARIIDDAAHSWSRWTQSPQVLNHVRNRLAAAIERYQT